MYKNWRLKEQLEGHRRPDINISRGTALNPLGELFVILLIIVVIVGAVSHEILIGAVGVLAFVVAMVSRLWAALSIEELTIDRDVSVNHAFQGDDIEVTFTIENRKPLPVPWLEISEYVPRGLLIEGRNEVEQAYLGGAEMKISASLGGYERLKVKKKITALSRGTYRLGKSNLRSGDLFGLYPSEASLEHTPWSIFVYPKIQAMTGFMLPARRPIGDSVFKERLWDDPSRPAGVREYQPGDPIKRIDWKVTARRDQMFVRQFDPSVSEHMVIFAEAITTDVPWEGYRSDVLEGSMTAAASIADHALQLGYKVGLITNGVSSSAASHAVITPGYGSSHLTALLESLAMVHPIGVRSLDELARSRRGAIPSGSTIIHIGGIYHPRTINYLRQLSDSNHPVILLHTGREDPPEHTEFEVRDGRPMFLDSSNSSTSSGFQRSSNKSSQWDNLPISGQMSADGSQSA